MCGTPEESVQVALSILETTTAPCLSGPASLHSFIKGMAPSEKVVIWCSKEHKTFPAWAVGNEFPISSLEMES